MNKTGNVLSSSFRKFGETTTVKGVSRAVSSKALCLQVMWIVAVIFGAGFALYQLVTIFDKYFSYETVITVDETLSTPEFPDVTLCKLNPLSSKKKGEMNFNGYMETLELLKETIVHQSNQSNASSVEIESIFDKMSSVSGYNENFKIPNVENITSDLMWDCKVYDWDWSIVEGVDCVNELVTLFWNPHHDICMKLNLSSSTHNTSIKGVSLFLFLDHSEDFIALDYDMDILNSKSSGIRLIIHPPNTLPDITTGINIPTGNEITVRLDTKERIYSEAPYSSCQYRSYLEKEGNVSKTSPAYDQSACLDVCHQDHVYRECGCLSADARVDYTNLYRHNFCGNFSASEQVFKIIIDLVDKLCMNSKTSFVNGPLIDGFGDFLSECADKPKPKWFDRMKYDNDRDWVDGYDNECLKPEAWNKEPNVDHRPLKTNETNDDKVYNCSDEHCYFNKPDKYMWLGDENLIQDINQVFQIHDLLYRLKKNKTYYLHKLDFEDILLLAIKYFKSLSCLKGNHSTDKWHETLTSNKEILQSVNKTINQLLCASRVNISENQCDCPLSCRSTEYETSVSQTPWPHWTYLYGIYCKYVVPKMEENPKLMYHFKTFTNLFKNCSDRSHNKIFKKMMELEMEDIYMVSNNFLQLSILFPSKRTTVFNTHAAMTWDTLFSNMGGTLNLWIGITFVTIVEIMELVFNICAGHLYRQKIETQVIEMNG